jgi:hypothetical protein
MAKGAVGQPSVRVQQELLRHRHSHLPHHCRSAAVAGGAEADVPGSGLGPERGRDARRSTCCCQAARTWQPQPALIFQSRSAAMPAFHRTPACSAAQGAIPRRK